MHIITRKRLREFSDRYPDAAQPLDDWFKVVRQALYVTTHDVKRDFSSVSFLGGSKTVFNIGGNKYRLVVDMRYDLGRVYIRHVLTHEEYGRRSREGTL